MAETSWDELEHRRYWDAYNSRRFADALAASSQGLVRQMLHLLRRDGHEVNFKRPPEDSVEFFGAIAAALNTRLEEEGEAASLSLTVAGGLAGSLFQLQSCLKGPRPDNMSDEDWLSYALLSAFFVGSHAEHIGLTLSGHFHEFADLKHAMMERTAKQAEAARKTNAQKRSVRHAALEAAQDLCRSNPTLSNEDLALKARQRLGLSTTLKTMTRWMQGARRSGALPEIKRA